MMPFLTLLLACGSGGVVLDGGPPAGGGGDVAGGGEDGGDDGDVGGDEGSDEGTGDGGSDGGEDDTGTEPMVVDCSELSAEPLESNDVDGAKGYHGLAFDSEGRMYGSDGSSLIRATRDGEWEVWVPGVGPVEQIAFLPDGRLVVSSASSGDIVAFSPEGGQERLASSVWSYAVLPGPDGRLYLSSGKFVVRLDLETGEQENIAAIKLDTPPHAMQFSNDYSALYVGVASSSGNGGVVYRAPLDENLDLTEELTPFAEGVGYGWHDAIAVDACDNLYVSDFGYQTMYRISPDGSTVEPFIEWKGGGQKYAHSAIWGGPVGGWSTDALYVSMPYKSLNVMEHVVGVGGRDWEGEVIPAE